MKKSLLWAFSSLLCVSGSVLAVSPEVAPASAPASTPAVAAPKTPGPHIQFETPVYDFGKSRGGEPVKHTFVFTNIGDAELTLTDVHPGCGCTTAGEWTKNVAPGKTGSIPIQVNTANFNGPVTKMVTVTSNDKNQPSMMLQIKGTIWKPVEVNPQFAVLNIPSDASEETTTTVKITNNMEEPITLSQPESSNKAFRAQVKTNVDGKSFDLVVTAIPPLAPGNVQGQISVKTSSTNMPVVTVTAWANVQPPITVMPPQLNLASGPLTSKTTLNVNIQNNSTNALVLSEPTVNAKDVEVQLREVQPNKLNRASVTFPQGV